MWNSFWKDASFWSEGASLERSVASSEYCDGRKDGLNLRAIMCCAKNRLRMELNRLSLNIIIQTLSKNSSLSLSLESHRVSVRSGRERVLSNGKVVAALISRDMMGCNRKILYMDSQIVGIIDRFYVQMGHSRKLAQ